MSDTPVGRARDAAAFQFPIARDMTIAERHRQEAKRVGFKYAAAWSRTDALTPPSEEEVETAAIAFGRAVHPYFSWSQISDLTRDHYRNTARAALSAFLDHRRNA